MITYYKHVEISFSEVKEKSVLLLFGLTGCMFHCYKCINYVELIQKKHDQYYTIEDILHIIQLEEALFDWIILSGGEYLMAPVSKIIDDLEKIKKMTRKPIIIYTTGYYLEKMELLWKKRLVEGFHVDMKLPYHLLTSDDHEIIKYTIGKSLHTKDIQTLIKAIDFTVSHDSGFNQIRSVRYPHLDESAFDECRLFIQKLNEKYQKQTPYEVHPFYDLGSIDRNKI